MLGLTGSPGAGKSTWAAALVDSWGGASSAVLLTMTALWLTLGSWPFVASLFDAMRRRRQGGRGSADGVLHSTRIRWHR